MHDEKIMVVDDEYEVADIVKKMLESEGYSVVVANSGDECLEKLDTVTPDLILLDIMMPGMDGWETLKNIKTREATKDIPVSMLTALPLTPDDTKEKPLDSIENYIVKPFTKKILLHKIQDILERKKEINDMYETIKVEVGDEEAEEYKRLSLAVNRQRRLVGVIVDSTVSELKDSVKNLLVSQKRMIEMMNKKIEDIERQVDQESGNN
ncbi:MAG: response regulator [Candidatus Thermoplasmatota archaeon]|nr:response regulator [Candidatus Thermoplasmatota archaeon]